MEEQRSRSQTSQQKDIVTKARSVDEFKKSEKEKIGLTKFEYDVHMVTTFVSGSGGNICPSGVVETDSFIPESTPFYISMGGQVGDVGTVEINGSSFEISSVEKIASGSLIHDLKVPTKLIQPGSQITLRVDEGRRAKIEAHHSGTHLLNWALRKVVGNTITQKGSYVGPDRLRFDFSHGAALTSAELAEVEKLVNEKIEADVPVKGEERPYAEVRGDPRILQFFGDKYGDTVRVVSIGDFSKELCGGTHVRQSGKVGYFKILHEAAIAAGIRRIEAASGDALQAHLEELLRKQDEQLAHASEATLLRARLHGGAATTAESLPELWQRYKDREKLLHDMAAQRAQHEKD